MARPRSISAAAALVQLLVLCVLLAQVVAGAQHTEASSRGNHRSSGGSAKSSTTTANRQQHTQLPTAASVPKVSASTNLPSKTRSMPLVEPSGAPIALNDSQLISTDLDAAAKQGTFFTFKAAEHVPMYISMSLCSGPEIPAYNTSNQTLLDQLDMKAEEARTATLVSLYVSDSAKKREPGPRSSLSSDHLGHAQGGWTQVTLPKGSKDGIWIGIWPPQDPRGRSGKYRVQLGVSTKARLEYVANQEGLRFDDSDAGRALLTSFNYTNPAPNISLIVLPTEGRFSLSSIRYFNSSFCAIREQWSALQSSPYDLFINSSETTRGTVDLVTRGDLYREQLRGEAPKAPMPTPSVNGSAGMPAPGSGPMTTGDARSKVHELAVRSQYNETGRSFAAERPAMVRMQFQVDGLARGSNYTAYLVSSAIVDGVESQTLYPAVKFTTKETQNCRLMYNVPFCPELAYSVPYNDDMSLPYAMHVLEEMIASNYANFSATLDTFPCESEQFGLYSTVATCDDCRRAYQNWLCSVAIPRCTDPVEPNRSAASQDGTNLEGLPMPTNTELLPYIVNRIGHNSSRQSYIDKLFHPGNYGELLPCIATCEMVTRSCPPLLDWSCPIWTVTAQRDYGTFADADSQGRGRDENGGAGDDGLRYGGSPSTHVAQDAFGRVYCNPMDADRILRLSARAAPAVRPVQGALLTAAAAGAVLALGALA